MKRRLAVLALAAVIAAGSSCGDEGPPTPGSISVKLVSPKFDDGAILVTLTGPGIIQPHAATTSLTMYYRLVTSDTLRVILFGDIATGPILTIDVADIRHPELYVGAVLDVSDRTGNDRTSPLTGYSLETTVLH